MAYKGKPRIVECNKGGLTGAQSIDDLQPYMMIHPTRNVILEKRGRRKRGGTAHLYSTAYPATKILGIYRPTFANLSVCTMVATDAGIVYSSEVYALKSGLSTTNYYSFVYASSEDKVFFTDGLNAVQQWNGIAASSTAITGPATDWTTTPPFQLILHGKGVSQRLWAINSLGVYASKSFAAAGDLESFATGGENMYILTDDGHGLVGGVEFGDRLLVFGKNKGYLIDDTDSSTSNWGYQALQWDGGVAHWRLIIKTPNDVILMAEDGEIYSATAVESYGDYKRASITRGSWMHDWIKDNVDLTYIDEFHGLYDPVIRAVMIWVVRNGKSSIDTALVFFMDRESPEESWMVFDNQNYDSGYSASAAAVVSESVGAQKVYTGDYSGWIWKLHETNRADNGNIIQAGFKSVSDSCEDPAGSKHFNELHVLCTPQGNYNLNVKVWIDGEYKSTKSMTMMGKGAVLGSFILDTDVVGGDEFITIKTKLGYRGKRIQYEFYQHGASEDFFICSYHTEYKSLGITQ